LCVGVRLTGSIAVTTPVRSVTRTFRATCQVGASSAVAVDDPAAFEIVRRELDGDAIAGIDSDPVAAHLAGGVTERGVSVVELDLEQPVAEGLDDLPLQLDLVFLLSDNDLFRSESRARPGSLLRRARRKID
jgi:hypothetical protein